MSILLCGSAMRVGQASRKRRGGVLIADSACCPGGAGSLAYKTKRVVAVFWLYSQWHAEFFEKRQNLSHQTVGHVQVATLESAGDVCGGAVVATPSFNLPYRSTRPRRGAS